ncbi:MAG: ABC transporter substrate-binding protein, partial [Promethearchaeati archaeon]
MRKRKTMILCSVIGIIALTAIPVNPFMIKTQANPSGPYLDKIRYEVTTDEEQAIASLGDGDIDLIGELLDPTYLTELEEMENVAAQESLENGYVSIIVNCHRYPLNLTAFRRALSFAVDKYALRDDVLDGLGVPLDSCVPKVNPFSIENQLSNHYYDGDVQRGKDILAAAGFEDYDQDGVLEAPNESEFTVVFEADEYLPITVDIGQRFVDTLNSLDIDAEIHLNDGSQRYLDSMHYGDFDLILLGHHFPSFDVDWLAYEYWSEMVDDEYAVSNYPRFENASYDFWREQLLNGTEYDEVYEAAIEMQKIWVYQCPEIVCCEYIKASAYR